MRESELKKIENGELVKAYANAAVAHRQASWGGDYKRANKEYDTIAAIYRELRERGESAQRLLLPLLEHPDPAVKSWAAAHALEFSPNEGERVLEELSQGTGMLSLNAETTLSEWRKGTLSFP